MRWLLTIFTILVIPHHVLAQKSGFEIESHIYNIIQQGDDAENKNYYNLLLYYYDNPIDINKTNSL